MRLLILLPLLALTGCGATPVFLGDETAGAGFYARLTEFRIDAGARGVLHSLGATKEAEAAGCQLSIRGAVPLGTKATLHAGDCRANLSLPEPEPEPDGIWIPPPR